MYSKQFILVLVLFIICASSFSTTYYQPSCKAAVTPKFFVDDDYDSSTPGWQIDHFDTIQDAIDNASINDRIIVYNGNYAENLRIHTTGLNIFGEDKEHTILTGTPGSDVIIVSAAQVNISHFTIKCSSGANQANNSLIHIDNSHAIITDNILQNGQNAITLNHCDHHIIYDNLIQNNDGDAVHLDHSDSNTITWNTITTNNQGVFAYNSVSNIINNNTIQHSSTNGMFMNHTCNSNTLADNLLTSHTTNGIFLNDHCIQNTIYNNLVSENSATGIRIENSSSNNITTNNINNNTEYGLLISGSTNTIWENTIADNSLHGMFIFADDHTHIQSNTISSNTYDGIRSHNSTANTITKNTITANTQYGVYLDYFTRNNIIYNNYLSTNTINARDKSLNHNTWNYACTGTNIIGGPSINGNYWNTYDETSEGAIDTNNDGIADSPYTIYNAVTDNGPLLDVTAPTVGTPHATPSSQSAGQTLTISVTVTDNTEIRDVRLITTDPLSATTNSSILQNKSGTTYTCSKAYSTIGDYTYHIAACDTRNWQTTTTQTFHIHKGTPPSITDNSPTTGTPITSYTFNATVTSGDTNPADLTVYVNWEHGGSEDNHTLTNTGGNYFAHTITLDDSINNLKYYLFAKDQWGNARRTTTQTIPIIDTIPPQITIQQHGPSYQDLPNSFTFAATITDDVAVDHVYIEYWYSGSPHITSDMDNTQTHYYEKIIIPENSPAKVYCVIYANDTSDNTNDTTQPFAEADGPYSGYINAPIQFNATASYDLDGNITEYLWDYGDGTTGTGAIAQHSYTSRGTYSITLTITDNDENTRSDTTTATVIPFIQQKTSTDTLNQINTLYNLELTELFYAYDSDGDETIDTFVDPNNVLTPVQPNSINLSGNQSFLLSIDDTTNPEFLWFTPTDTITQVTKVTGTIGEITEADNQATVEVHVEKPTGWIYIEAPNRYPQATLTDITSDYRSIPADRRWYTTDNIYLLDDPVQTYYLIYEDISLLTNAVFTPQSGNTIDHNTPTITFTYNVPVTIIYADFVTTMPPIKGGEVSSQLVTSDHKTFSYTPAADLEEDTYALELLVEDEYGNQVDDRAVYTFIPYAPAEQTAETGFNWMLFAATGGILGVALMLFYVYVKKKGIQFNLDYMYIKNRRILPFLRPLVFGPLSINIAEDSINKAEIYVDGDLKTTLTTPPYQWQWNEKSYLKHTIETKIYDNQGNAQSSGEMPFYIFNPTGASSSTGEAES